MAITQTTPIAMRKTALVGISEIGFIWNILTAERTTAPKAIDLIRIILRKTD